MLKIFWGSVPWSGSRRWDLQDVLSENVISSFQWHSAVLQASAQSYVLFEGPSKHLCQVGQQNRLEALQNHGSIRCFQWAPQYISKTAQQRSGTRVRITSLGTRSECTMYNSLCVYFWLLSLYCGESGVAQKIPQGKYLQKDDLTCYCWLCLSLHLGKGNRNTSLCLAVVADSHQNRDRSDSPCE